MRPPLCSTSYMNFRELRKGEVLGGGSSTPSPRSGGLTLPPADLSTEGRDALPLQLLAQLRRRPVPPRHHRDQNPIALPPPPRRPPRTASGRSPRGPQSWSASRSGRSTRPPPARPPHWEACSRAEASPNTPSLSATIARRRAWLRALPVTRPPSYASSSSSSSSPSNQRLSKSSTRSL
jgi:hypothetical protein